MRYSDPTTKNKKICKKIINLLRRPKWLRLMLLQIKKFNVDFKLEKTKRMYFLNFQKPFSTRFSMLRSANRSMQIVKNDLTDIQANPTDFLHVAYQPFN